MIRAIRDRVNNLPRRWKSLILAGFDACALVGILWLSFQLRLGTTFQPTLFQWALILLAPIVALPIFLRLGLYRSVIRYLPDRAVWTILQAMALATLSWVFLLFVAEATRFAAMPRSIPLFYFLLGTVVVAGSRFTAKYLLWTPVRQQIAKTVMLIYGAGSAGTQLATALRTHREGFVAGFLDDDVRLHGRDVMGIRVYPPSAVERLIRDVGVTEILLCIPSSTSARRNAIVSDLSRLPVKIRTLPGIGEIASGKYLVGQLREIDIDDLLGRSSVPADPELLRTMIEGRVAMVTGAGGSIGSELCRLIAKWSPAKLVLLEANEFALYQIERTLNHDAAFPIVPVLGSVTDDRLVRRTLAEEGVTLVFHAAAHKHVPLVEANPFEGVRNNVFGTLTVATAALEGGVSDFVLISTDKAVHPSSVMGATKRWAELIVRDAGDKAASRGSGKRFTAVRFGNVLGSNGSVVPLFREQIAAGGPVTLTDERMTRYFMSIHEAAELIVQAGALSEGRDVFLLDMGQPVLIRDLAENMIRLAGLTVRSDAKPDGDIAITLVGSRPGEKLFEELFYDPANAEPTRHPKILRAQMSRTSANGLPGALAELQAALDTEDEDALRRRLFDWSLEPPAVEIRRAVAGRGMNRAFELVAATAGLVVASPVILILIALIKADSPGPAILTQTRVGQGERTFPCHKLRTMHAGTATLPTHLVGAAQITRIGGFLRKTKLDELPQLLNIVRGEMSFVGPRPCLPTQTELIEERRRRGVFKVRPGLTGLAQVQGIDMSDPPRLAEVDAAYLETRTFTGDLGIIVQTFFGGGNRGASRT